MSNPISTRNYGTFTWIDIYQPSQHMLGKIGKEHQIEPKHLTDSLQHGHLPKLEKLSNYTFLLLRAYSAKKDAKVNNVGDLSNKIAMYFNPEFLITIHRYSFKFLDQMKDHYERPEELVLDITQEILDSFDLPVKEQSEQIDALEESLFVYNSQQLSIENLYYQRSKARISKKLLMFSQSALNQLKVPEHLAIHLQDQKDTLTDLVLWYDEILDDATNLLNTYLSINSKNSNDTMKLLTVFSAFFLPLTFIVGVYGMNFHFMPELSWQWGYPLVIAVMLSISLIIYFWFRKKGIL